MRQWIRSRDRMVSIGGFALALAGFGLVIWLKLRVVSSVPRTAYADPDRQDQGEVIDQTQPPPVDGPENQPAAPR